jgi:hypothetical protein
MTGGISTKSYPPRAFKAEGPRNRPGRLQGRKILPPNATPSITCANTDRVVHGELGKNKAEKKKTKIKVTRQPVVNTETTKIKVSNQLLTQYALTKAETILGTPFERGKTALQGAQEQGDNAAAHGCYIPEPIDKFAETLPGHIVNNGVTPSKTEPYLKNRGGFSSPMVKQLHERHQDEAFVRKTLKDELPAGSSLTNTRFHWNCNATFGNPKESNQYDSRLEKKIAPFLKELQDLRMGGSLTPEESLERLVNWLSKYHATSITALETQLVNIDSLTAHFQGMRTFERDNLTVDLIPEEAFTSYLNAVNQFLICYDALTAKKSGCPSCAEFKSLRNDFSFLRKLQSMAFEQQSPVEDVSQFYLENRRHLANEMHCDCDSISTKYRLYLDEAKAQQEAVQDFEEPCAIPNLSKMLFGIMENGVRRAPTDEELRSQVFKLFALATPAKIEMAKRRRDEEDSKENIDPAASPEQKIKRNRLKF